MDNEQLGENNDSEPKEGTESAPVKELTQEMSIEEVAQAVKKLAQNRSSFPRNWQPGHRLQNGKYIIIKELGRGGFGITYLATDNQGEKVVIKILKDELLRQDVFNQLEEDFVNEAIKLSQFNHPNIVPIIKVIYDEGWCIVMKYIEGKTLEDLVQKRGSCLSPKEALRYIKQIGEALKVVHAQGLLHRDVKPQNIIIQEDTKVAVLIDFGLALKFDRNPARNNGGISHGYAPIEQYEPIAIWGDYTDVYALAATLYFMLTKQRPMPARIRAAGDIFLSSNKFNKAISNHLNDAIKKGMSLEPTTRPETVDKWLFLIKKRPRLRVAIKILIILFILFSVGSPLAFVVNYLTNNQYTTRFSNIKDVPKGAFRYAGSTAWAPFQCKGGIHTQIQSAQPGFQLNHVLPKKGVPPNSGRGIDMLINGDVDFAVSSRRLKNEETKKAKSKGFDLETIPVAGDVIAIAVNRNLEISKVRGLTVQQLKDIYTSRITNWQEVGGPNQEITPYTHEATKNTVYDFQKNVLDGQPFGKTVEYVKDTTTGLQDVEDNPGGIYHASATLIFGRSTVQPLPIGENRKELTLPFQKDLALDRVCQNVDSESTSPAPLNPAYPKDLQEEMYVVVKDYDGNTNTQERAGRAYAELLRTGEGQKLIEQIGFQRIH